MLGNGIRRRDVLRTVAAGATVGAFATGEAAARNDTGRHIVGASSRAAVDEARRRADSVYRVIELGSYPTAVAGVFPEDARKQLGRRRDVEYVEKDVTHGIVGETLPWGIDRVDADVAHSDGETGGDNSDGEGGTDISIIDTGIDDDHPDLVDNLGVGKAFQGSSWDDDNGHGTHVAGTADAVNNTKGVVGVSTGAVLHAARVCNGGGLCFTSDIAAALEWTADQGYDVANLSLGGGYSETVDNAGKYAYDNGVLLVAAAGNDGECTDCVGYPAANEEFIAVSATTCNDSLAGFSSTGCQVELAAPGKDVYSTVPGGYDTFSGTSMASPHVAGAGAQLMDNGYANAIQSSSDAESAECYPTSPGGARGQLQDSAEDIGLPSNEQGDGLVDVAAALGLSSTDDGTGTGPNCGDDGGGGGGGGGSAPTVDSLSLKEDNSGGSPHADFDASWKVSDDDGDLDTVDLTLYELDSNGNRTETEDSASLDVSGSDASGTTDLKAKFDENNDLTYEVELVVTDANGNTASDIATETEDGQ